MIPGDVVWAPHPELTYCLGTVTKTSPLTISFQDADLTELEIKDTEHVFPDDGEIDFNVPDLTTLASLNEATLLEALERRFQEDAIYTFTGTVLLAINPFKEIKSLYGTEVMSKFERSTKRRPHPYAIADLR